MRFTKTWITKLKNNIKHHWNQETASRSNEKTWEAERKRNRIWIILSWREDIFLNE